MMPSRLWVAETMKDVASKVFEKASTGDLEDVPSVSLFFCFLEMFC